MKKLRTAIAAVALIGTPAFAADMAVKAPPPPAPVPTWTGFYGGIQLGGGWSDEAVSYSPNDPAAAEVLNGTFFPALVSGKPGQPVIAPTVHQSGPVGGLEFGYNWQAASRWLVGFEADVSASGLRGSATNISTATIAQGPLTVPQTTTAEQRGDWYGTVRGRLGWLATPNLLLFGTGGFAYGRVVDSANYGLSGSQIFGGAGFAGAFSFGCGNANLPPGFPGPICSTGSAGGIRTGWAAGGGLEWLFSQHWTAKIEYQFVDLGTRTVRVTNLAFVDFGLTPSSFNAVFHDRFNVVRVGLNYHFGGPMVAKY